MKELVAKLQRQKFTSIDEGVYEHEDESVVSCQNVGNLDEGPWCSPNMFDFLAGGDDYIVRQQRRGRDDIYISDFQILKGLNERGEGFSHGENYENYEN